MIILNFQPIFKALGMLNLLLTLTLLFSIFSVFAHSEDCRLSLQNIAVPSPERLRNNVVYLKPDETVSAVCRAPRTNLQLQWQYINELGGGVICGAQAGSPKCKSDLEPTADKLSVKVENPRERVDVVCISSLHPECANVTLTVIVADESVVPEPEQVVLNYTESSRVALSCQLSDETKQKEVSDVEWLFDNKPITYSDDKIKKEDNNTLTIMSAKSQHTGVYTCKLTAKNLDKTTYQNFIHVYGPGKIDSHHKPSKNMLQGETVTMDCNANGHPQVEVRWFRGNVSVEPQDAHLFLNAYNGIANASLTISDLRFEDRDDYFCVAANKYGEDKAATVLRVKDKLAALWPFLGICAEVLILVTIIFLYEKRRAKLEADEDANDEANEQKKSLTQSPDKDLRQRKP